MRDLAPGESVEVDADEIAYPQPFSNMPPADYEVQVVLDPDHSYNYSGRGPQDWISNVTALARWTPGTGTEPSLTIDQHPPVNPQRAAMIGKAMANARPGVAQKEEFVSPLLSRFWGHPVAIRAWVILPRSYSAEAQERYPTVYWTHGFGANLDYCLVQGMSLRDLMAQGKMPPMIWVMLDESIPEGTHEFADSVNNGPGRSAHNRVPAVSRTQIPYGRAAKWPFSERPFERWLGNAATASQLSADFWWNLVHIARPERFSRLHRTRPLCSGCERIQKTGWPPWPIMRAGGKVVATLEQFAKLEAVLGPYGGQMSSFDWVFSPKSDSGAPEPMFDRKTGVVDAKVVAYWHDHYDLAHIVEANWATRGPDLKGRIHLLVGTADTFYLDGSARLFEAVLNRLGAEPHFSYLPNKTHFDLYAVGEDRLALFDRISAEMYAIARPGKEWKPTQVAH